MFFFGHRDVLFLFIFECIYYCFYPGALLDTCEVHIDSMFYVFIKLNSVVNNSNPLFFLGW